MIKQNFSQEVIHIMALKDLADWGSKVSSCGGDKPSACGGKKSVSCGGDKPSACGGKK